MMEEATEAPEGGHERFVVKVINLLRKKNSRLAESVRKHLHEAMLLPYWRLVRDKIEAKRMSGGAQIRKCALKRLEALRVPQPERTRT